MYGGGERMTWTPESSSQSEMTFTLTDGSQANYGFRASDTSTDCHAECALATAS